MHSHDGHEHHHDHTPEDASSDHPVPETEHTAGPHSHHAEAETTHAHHTHSTHTAHNHTDTQHTHPVKTDSAHAHHSHAGSHSGHDHHAGHGVMHEGHLTMMRDRFFITLPMTIIVLIFSPMIQQWFGYQIDFAGSQWVAPILGTIIFFYGGLPFLSMARQELAIRQPGMMTLISVAITTAYLYSLGIFLFPPTVTDPNAMPMDFFWELATLISIMLLGHWIELRSVGQAQGALNELAKLLPDTAERILPSGETETVSVNQLAVGDRVLIRPGASIPVDGVVHEGESHVNESMITGESRPIHKTSGETVIAGTVNGSGSLRVEIQRIGDETALAGIMRLVEDAQKSQSQAQTLAQRAAFYLTIIALVAGGITFVAWLVSTGSLFEAVRYTVGVLVVACPHALGLAVPLVIAISTTLSAKNGLLVRQRIALEKAKDLNIVIFDKTGTLTRGEQGVVNVATLSHLTHEDAVRIAAGVEGDSEHMIATALREYAKSKSIEPAVVSHFSSLAGRGVTAQVDGKSYFVGGPRLLQQRQLQIPEAFAGIKQTAEQQGQSVIYLADEQQVLAVFAIADVIRDESHDAVEALHELNVKVAMLTGDSEAVASAVAHTLQIDTYFAEVLPEHKADKVRELQQNGDQVAMVGDGVNDAPALVTADVGIAIGAGTDVAIESAGIILVRSNPLDVVKIIRLSRATYRKMIENLAWAVGYNVIAIPLAMGVLAPWGIILDPAVGAILMSLSTVIVAFNAQLLRRVNLD